MITAAKTIQRVLLYEGDGSRPFETQERYTLLEASVRVGLRRRACRRRCCVARFRTSRVGCARKI